MKKCIFLVIFLLSNFISIAQENRKEFDFIVCVDDEIATSLESPRIIVKRGNEVLKRIDIDYHAGNLSMSDDDYNAILSEQDISLFLEFGHYYYSNKGKLTDGYYEIEMGKNWFDNLFVIIYIYNLDKKKYKLRFDPLSKDQNYTFELHTSNGQMLRVKQRK